MKHKGSYTEFVKVHSLSNPITWILIGMTGGSILIYWIVSPQHTIRII